MSKNPKPLPIIIAGPIIRHVDQNTLTIWLVSTQQLHHFSKKAEKTGYLISLELFNEQMLPVHVAQSSISLTDFQVGEHCFINTLVVSQDALLSCNSTFHYDILIKQLAGTNSNTDDLNKDSSTIIRLSETHQHMLYEKQALFSVKYTKNLRNVLHGSCRKAHFDGKDSLPQLDKLLQNSINKQDTTLRPDLIMFTGDQVYVDDVAGPMLHAIHQVIQLLGLFHETFEGSTISHSSELFEHVDSFYQRVNLLPKTADNENVSSSFFKAKRKPIFTSVNALNHLISLNEVIGLYLLSWSSRLWPFLNLEKHNIDQKYLPKYTKEVAAINHFKEGLPEVERALAHIPVYMIFDDHDITDDWNLTREWEEHVYGNPFSRRIVGNALLGYFLCQGLGNPKYTWENLIEPAQQCFKNQRLCEQGTFINILLEHSHWQYKLDTNPPIQVLDTRTQRWRSESNPRKPSGLMDWEALCELQQDIIGQKSVIMVSAAPVYGVKLIEAIQRVFITFGGALVVDAENWMAHKGTASVMLNIFRHIKTPPNFIILSGDVHYSFVYDISLRFRRNSPKITQFTASGIHNQFPNTLISWFERLNRIFYGHRSPLNWLTKRRNMSIKERKALFEKAPQKNQGIGEGKDIVNGSSIGLLTLNEHGNEHSCKLILADGSMVSFKDD